MPTYRNDGSAAYKVVNTDDESVRVAPGGTVQMWDQSGNTDFTLIDPLPAMEITVDEAPGAAGAFTSPIAPSQDKGYLNISVTGNVWDATVTLQRSFDGGETWRDFATFNSNYEDGHEDHEPGVLYRIGVKNGEYISGAVTVRASR